MNLRQTEKNNITTIKVEKDFSNTYPLTKTLVLGLFLGRIHAKDPGVGSDLRAMARLHLFVALKS